VGVSVVGVASRLIIAVEACREASAAAGTNPARGRRLTMAGRTGHIVCFVEEKTMTSLIRFPSLTHPVSSLHNSDRVMAVAAIL